MKIIFLFTLFVLNFNVLYSFDNLRDSLTKKLKISNNNSEKANILYKLSEYYSKTDVLKSIEYIEKAETLALSMRDSSKLLKIYVLKGNNYYTIGNYKNSLIAYKKAEDISKLLKDTLSYAKVLNNVGAAYSLLGQKDKSIDYMKKSFRYFKQLKNYYYATNIAINISSVYADLKNRKEVYKYLNEYYKVSQKTPMDIDMRARMFEIEASIYLKINDTLNAIDKINKSLIQVETSINETLKGEVYLLAGEIFLEFNYNQKSIEYLRKSLEFSKKTNTIVQLKNGYERLAQNFDALRKIDSAYKYTKLYVKYKDSIFIENQKKDVKMLELNYKIKLNKKRLKLLDVENKVLKEKKNLTEQKNKTLYLVVFFILLILILFVLIVKIRFKKAVIEKRLLTKQINIIERELNNFAYHIVQKNNSLIQLKKNLKKIIKTNDDSKKEHLSKETLLILEAELGIQKDRLNFYKKTSDLSKKFISKFSLSHPNLTENEKKLISFLRLGLSSKEIASILNISHSSVNINRYRLRKKLNLSSNMDLLEYLNSFD